MFRSDRNLLPGGRSGRWLVVGLLVVGFIVLAGFFTSRQYWQTTLPATRPATIP